MAKSKSIRIGIDIGTNSIKLASFYTKKSNRKHAKIIKYDFLEEDIVTNIREINETHIMNGLKELLSQVPYKRASINVGLSASFQNLFFMQLPQIASHELKQALFWELTPLLPDPVDSYDYDYALLPQSHKKKLNVLLAVIKKNRIEWLQKVFKSLSTNMRILETSSLPAIDLFSKSHSKLSEAVGVLQMGGSNSHYTIFDPAQYPEFLYVPFGGNTLNSIISKNSDIPFAEVEYLRRGILETSTTGQPLTSLYMENKKVESTLRDLALTIRKLNFRHFYNTGQKIVKLYVTGGLMNDTFISGFFNMAGDIMDVPAEPWDPIPEYYPEEEHGPHNAFQYATAIGLSLR
jgi:Tfp pilus assembly PilM family ATPase